ncbi:hypothetical protein LCGC14_0595170 [marine sediment metagenome]|uniref:Uncharacterized protein n=1 Tax=marine sediment metagenome TaxID=412755 RepID=A0A0F9UKN3_9ZZZZ
MTRIDPSPTVVSSDVSLGGRVMVSSDLLASLVVNAVAANVALPDVVVPASLIPTGTAIQRVICAMSWRKSVDSSSLANAVNVAQAVQVRDDSPSAFVDAINLPDNSLAHAADGIEGGFMLVGDNDVKATVDGADTYNFQWTLADVDGASLTFYDVQTHIIIDYA